MYKVKNNIEKDITDLFRLAIIAVSTVILILPTITTWPTGPITGAIWFTRIIIWVPFNLGVSKIEYVLYSWCFFNNLKIFVPFTSFKLIEHILKSLCALFKLLFQYDWYKMLLSCVYKSYKTHLNRKKNNNLLNNKYSHL